MYSYLHIYITSDEEIKEGDWFYNPKFNEIGINYNPDSCKKIILTTDQDLINDGVQSIDDEFLKWFIKNPSCEFVEIGEGIEYEDEWIDNEDGGEIYQHQYSCYKITIEELRLPTAKELFDKMLLDNDETTSTEMMIEFAKLHCEAQLKAILEKAEAINQAKFKGDCNPQIDAESIINAYDLNQIK